MLRISESQIELFTSNRTASFKESVANHLHRLAPDHVENIGAEDFDEFLNQAIVQAQESGVRQRETTRLWIELSMLWGIGFASDPTYGFARDIISESIPEVPKMRRLHAAAIDYTARASGREGEHFREALGRVASSETPATGSAVENSEVTQFLTRLWPERAQASGRKSLHRLVEMTANESLKSGSSRPADRLLFAVLGLFLGVKFNSDPQYRWLIEDPAGGAPTQDRLDALHQRCRAYLRKVLANA